MKDLEMIRLQEEHIRRLQEKLEEKKRLVIYRLYNTSGWVEFLLRHTNTYYRPHKSHAEIEQDITMWGKLDFVFDEEDSTKVSFRGSYNSKSGYNFRTIFFPIAEVEEFIKDSPAELPHKYQYWSNFDTRKF
jgi:hypothetical protein